MNVTEQVRRTEALYYGPTPRLTLCERVVHLEALVIDLLEAPCGTCDPWSDGFACEHYDGNGCALGKLARTMGLEV